MKIVLDTNVYISAFLSNSLAFDILLLGSKEDIKIMISPAIIAEVLEKLEFKFKVEKQNREEYLDLISNMTRSVIPSQKISVVTSDEDDNRILECAKESKADLIITMDKHLLKLKKFEKAAIVHPKTLSWITPDLFS